jgi:predicted RNA-binding Zn ribbon-like protein
LGVPYSRPAAPGSLERVETFCNSARFRVDEDAFADTASTRRWLQTHDWHAAADEVDEPERRELVRAREAIRAHLADSDSAVLNEYARVLLEPPQWRDRQLVISVAPGSAVEEMIGKLLAALAIEGPAGRAGRLKVCRATDCLWVYYDRSPGNNSIWCSMDICGARHKMRAYRSRRG